MQVLPHSIYMEVTPNPATMKFVSNRYIVTDINNSYEYTSADQCADSLLAQQLFRFPFVKSVFMAGNFITVTKSEAVEWADIQLELKDFVAEFLNSGKEAVTINEEPAATIADADSTTSETPKELTELEQKIVDVLDEYIRPAVANDGGAIEFNSFKDGTVEVILRGSCSGCPSSTMTLKNGIETLMTRMIPEVQKVEALNG